MLGCMCSGKRYSTGLGVYALDESDRLSFTHDYSGVIQSLAAPAGVVVMWDSRPVLIFHAASGEYFFTDISDLSAEQIANLGVPAVSHGMWYYLPGEIVQAIQDAPGAIAGGAEAVAGAIGSIAAAATGPLVGQLTLPLIAGLLIGGVYLMKK